MNTGQDARLRSMLDREELFDLVRRERFARDQGRFEMMQACLHEQAQVRTSWYNGTGGATYVDATRRMMGPNRNSKHWVFPALARIVGDRATVESPATIFNRVTMDGVEVDIDVYCRFFSRAVREDGAWKLLSFEVLFERDVMRAVHAGEAVPVDRSVLDSLRPSYRFLAFFLMSRGRTVDQELLGDDRPAQLEAFHAGEDAWLGHLPPASAIIDPNNLDSREGDR